MMKNKSKVFLVDKESGAIACKDGKFRTFVNFGTPNWCCKFWTSEGWAKRFAELFGLKSYTIVHLYEGDSVDACGNVTRA